MIDRFRGWFAQRSVREQRLLLAMGALFLIVFVWIGLFRPIGDRLSDARERHGQAVIALAATRAQADLILSLQRAAAPLQPGVALDELVKRAAAEGGFTAAAVTADGAGRANISIGAVRPPAFFGWLADLQRRYGLVVDRLSVRTNGDATLSVELGVRGRGA